MGERYEYGLIANALYNEGANIRGICSNPVSVYASGFHHRLLAAGSNLLDGSVLGLVDTLVKRIFGEVRLAGRDAFPAAALDLSVAAVDEVDVRGTQIYGLGCEENASLGALTQCAESRLERTHFGENGASVRS